MKGIIFVLLFLSIFVSFSYASDITLTWQAPTTNEDGTPLTDLAGYKIYFGVSSGNYTSMIPVGNVLTYTVGNLLVNVTYYFVATAYNVSGNESAYSNEVSKSKGVGIPGSTIAI